jgi:hypothetical protein
VNEADEAILALDGGGTHGTEVTLNTPTDEAPLVRAIQSAQ